MCVLATLLKQPRYGYDIAQHLASAGLGKVSGGTLYPILNRLLDAGLLTADWQQGEHGPTRKYYDLTVDGRTFLAEVSHEWLDFATSVERLLQPASTEGT